MQLSRSTQLIDGLSTVANPISNQIEGVSVMKNRKLFTGLVMLIVFVGAQFSAPVRAGAKRSAKETRFIVRIENISSPEGQTASDGTKWPFALSPGMWVSHDKSVQLFKEGKPALANGLEAQAEDGNPEELVKSLVALNHSADHHGIFNTPAGADGPGPIGPGGAYEFAVNLSSDMKLSVVLMFGQSNDYFYAPDPEGMSLFDREEKPLSGNITYKFILWDAGTEMDQEPGIGSDQAPRQQAHNTGVDQHGKVHRAKESSFYYKTSDLFRVTVTPNTQVD